MNTTTYMTAKLSLADGTIVYPQVSIDNMVKSISDPTLVSVATLSNGTVPTNQLPVVGSIDSASTSATIPTAKAVWDLAGGKGTVTGIAATVSSNTATVTATGGTGSVTITGSGNVTVTGTADAIIIGASGGGSVTGIAASVSGNTATVSATGSDTSVKFVGKDGVSVLEGANGEVDLAVSHLSGHGIFTNSAASLAANTPLVAVDYCDNKKNDTIEFYCEFSSFGTLTLSHGQQFYESYPVQIDGTNITVLDKVHSTTAATYAHGLTLNTFIRVTIKKANTGYSESDITIETLGGSFTVRDTQAYGCSDAVQAVATFACTNAKITYIVSDAKNAIWVFGDSYTGFKLNGWAGLFCRAGHPNVLFSGRHGSQAEEAIKSFNNLLTVGTPRYAFWAIGMNNPDSGSTVNASWLTYTQQFIATCEQKGIIPILELCPNTPTYLNVPKNNWIKASGKRYINFAKAVNAESAGSGWYTGMLDSDQLHPTQWGYEVLSRWFTIDFPESILQDNNPLDAGFGTSVSDYVVSLERYMPVESPFVSQNTITVKAGYSYNVLANTVYGYTLNAETVPSGYRGIDAYITMAVGEASLVQLGPNVVLVDPLIARAINHCTVKFNDGRAFVYVNDHIAGYIVVSNIGTGAGTFAYALSTATDNYVSFDVSLDGETVNLSGVTMYAGEKHIVGNGYDKTTVTGTATFNSSTTMATTFSNLTMRDVVIAGGTATLSDVYIPEGSTVSVTSGVSAGLIIEKIVGKGVLDFGGTTYYQYNRNVDIVSGCSCMNGGSYGCFLVQGKLTLKDARVTGRIANGGTLNLVGSTTIGFVTTGGTINLEDGVQLGLVNYLSATRINVGNSCTVNGHDISSGAYTSITSDGTVTPLA